jgi:hypothetical protein
MSDTLTNAKQYIQKRSPKKKELEGPKNPTYIIDPDGLRALADMGVTVSTTTIGGFILAIKERDET